MKKFNFLLILIRFNVICCDVFRLGKCPEVDLQKNFEVDLFKGEWFEIAKNPMFVFSNTRCNKIETRFNNRTLDIKSLSNSKTSKTTFIFDARAFARNSSVPARLTVQYPLTLFRTNLNIPYWILYTDYETALIWSCNNFGINFFNFQYIWILSRRPYIKEHKFTEMIAMLKKYDIDSTHLIKNDLVGCI